MKLDKKSLLIIFFCIVTTTAIGIFLSMDIETEKLNEIEIKIQILSFIFVLIGTIVAVSQYVLASNQNCENKEREYIIREKEIYEKEKARIEKAIDLSGYYKDNILSGGAIINEIFTRAGILNIQSNIRDGKIKEFDIHELEENLTQNEIKRIEKILISKELLQAMAEISLTEEIKGANKTKKVEVVDGKEVKTVSFESNELTICLESLISDTLNNMEYFAMHFVHKVADESVVYQSLHKSFLSLCEAMYYLISSRNKNGNDKTFINVIELYNIWNDRLHCQKRAEVENKRKNIIKGTSLS